MTYGTPGDKTRQFKAALVTAAQTATSGLTDPAHALLVRNGAPTARQLANFDDIVGAIRASGRRSLATAGTNRSIELEMTATLLISSWRPGTELDEDDSLQDAAEVRAFALLDAVGEYVRVTDTTLGQVVRKCVLTSHDEATTIDRELIKRGRLVEISAVFTAEARIAT